MRSIGIIVIRNDAGAGSAAQRLIQWLRMRGLDCLYLEELNEHYGISGGVAKATLVEKAELMVVLGGDGTFLTTVRMLKNRPTPILGINFGTLGFLSEINLDEIYEAVELTLGGKTRIRSRTMLDGECKSSSGKTRQFTVLNDFIIAKSQEAHLVELRISTRDVMITRVRGDGVIISTPTGSTAYNLSAGGPILHPELDCFVITPICPHSLTFRPVVIPADREIHIETSRTDRDVMITADGRGVCPLSPGDVFTVRRSESKVLKVISPRRGYFGVLRDKLRWGEE